MSVSVRTAQNLAPLALDCRVLHFTTRGTVSGAFLAVTVKSNEGRAVFCFFSGKSLENGLLHAYTVLDEMWHKSTFMSFISEKSHGNVSKFKSSLCPTIVYPKVVTELYCATV